MPTKQPKLVTRTVRLDALQPWPRNYREHPPQQVEAIAASLNTFTQVKNIVCVERDGVPFVVVGHGVTEGAKVAGWKEIEAKFLPPEWDDDQVEALLVADNRLSQLGQDNESALVGLLENLRVQREDILPAVGYTAGEIDILLNELTHGGDAGEFTPPAEFLGQFSADDDEGEGGEDDDDRPRTSFESPYVGLNLALTEEQRSAILAATERAKAQFAVPTTAEALVALCADWLTGLGEL